MRADYAEALSNFGALVGEKTGIIRRVEVMKTINRITRYFSPTPSPAIRRRLPA